VRSFSKAFNGRFVSEVFKLPFARNSFQEGIQLEVQGEGFELWIVREVCLEGIQCVSEF
jgi:hypothetical protein